MAKPSSPTEDYAEYAALIGHVTIAWNDCHSFVFSIFHELTGMDWDRSKAIFFVASGKRLELGVARSPVT
jgi:hypothetical protein